MREDPRSDATTRYTKIIFILIFINIQLHYILNRQINIDY